MPFTASVSRTIHSKAPDAFARFIDFTLWREFMPRSFEPLRGPSRPLRAGDRLRMLLDVGPARIPIPVHVFRVESPREIVWGGGSGLLHAAHHFVFEDNGDGTTTIRSDEEWTGLLTRVYAVARRVKRQAEAVGREQLDGFSRWIENRRGPG